MFSLSRVPKLSQRSSNNSSTSNTTSTNDDRCPNTTTSTSTTALLSARKRKKRSRGPPIPSFRDNELDRLEQEFLLDEVKPRKNAKSETNKNSDNVALPSAQPPTIDKATTQQNSSPSSCANPRPSVDINDDDSILEMHIFKRKPEQTDSQKDCPMNQGSEIKSSLLSPLPPVGMIHVHRKQEQPEAKEESSSFAAENLPNPTTKNSEYGSKPNPVNSVEAPIDHSLQSSNLVNLLTEEEPPGDISGVTDEIKRQIDNFLAKSDFNQVSLKNVYKLLGKQTCNKERKENIKKYVYEKLGIFTAKAQSTEKPPSSIAAKAKPMPTQKACVVTAVPTESFSDWTNPCVRSNKSPNRATDSQQPNALNEQGSDSTSTTPQVGRPAVLPHTEPIAPIQKPPHQLLDTVVGQSLPTMETKTCASKPRTRKRVAKKEEDDDGPTATTKRARAPPKRKCDVKQKGCQLCTHCPCRIAKESTEMVTLNKTQSDHAVEKSLIKQLQKCEKIAERYANQEDAFRRQLKSHRRDMWRRRERLQEMARQSRNEPSTSFFLPDAQEIEANFSLANCRKVVPAAESGKARERTFGKPNDPYHQVTLTQLMGGNDEAPNINDQSIQLDDDQKGGLLLEETASVDPVGDETPAEENTLENADVLPEGEYVAVERITWVDGEARDSNGERIVSRNSTLWSCALTGRPHSVWDRLFDDPASTENMGMDDLLEMLDHPDGSKESVKGGSPKHVDNTMLSQSGQKHSEQIIKEVTEDSDRLEAIRSVCPNWQENIRFAMYNREQGDLTMALSEVQETSDRLERGRVALQKLVDKYKAVLSLFEEALTGSLDRLEPSSNKVTHQLADSPNQRSDVLSQILEEDDCISVLTQNGGEESGLLRKNSPVEENAPSGTVSGYQNGYSVDSDYIQGDGISLTCGRRSIETDAETLVPTASPRRSSIETCQSPATTSMPIFRFDPDALIASQ